MNDDKKYQVMPDLTDEEYAELKADIAERGVMVPIEFDEDGNCLDGHHRLRACEELGLKNYPTVMRVGMTEDQKIEHALLENLTRRQLSIDQKREVIQWIFKNHDMPNARIAQIVCVSLHTVIEEREKWAAMQNADLPTSEGIDGKQYPASAKEAQAQREAIRTNIAEHPEMSDRQIAREMGVSHHTVAKQREVVDHIVSVFNPSARDAEALKDPDIQRRLAEDDKMNVAGALREQKRDQVVEHLDAIETQEAKKIEGVYDVIVVDPPWPVQKIETDRRPLQVNMDYPVMSLDEIKALKIPAADDCHVFLWTTEKLLPESFEILESWGARYVLTFVWHKSNGGYKPIDLPIYNCEFCLYGRIGTPVFTDDHQFKACFETSITGHSEKPEEFYDMIRRVTSGRRLDMFNRRHIDGFDGWGKEAVD